MLRCQRTHGLETQDTKSSLNKKKMTLANCGEASTGVVDDTEDKNKKKSAHDKGRKRIEEGYEECEQHCTLSPRAYAFQSQAQTQPSCVRAKIARPANKPLTSSTTTITNTDPFIET